MAKKTAAQIAEKYQRRYQASQPDYVYGVQNPSRDWLEGYRAASERMAQELQRALQEGRHLRGAEAAGTQKWKSRAAEIGARRFIEAAPEAARAFSAVAGEVMAAAEAARAAAQALPDTTYDQRKQRALAAMDAIHEHWRSRRS